MGPNGLVEEFLANASREDGSGPLCLEFVNTVDWHASEQPSDNLAGYPDLLAWAKRTTVIDEVTGSLLTHEALVRGDQAVAALKKAKDLREAIYSIFSSIAHGRPPAPEDLTILNRFLREAVMNLRLDSENHRIALVWAAAPQDLEQVLWPIAASAASLLASEALGRVKQCADDRGCGWLFLDRSKNRSRKWCRMASCGNRAKARRHYRRVRQADG